MLHFSGYTCLSRCTVTHKSMNYIHWCMHLRILIMKMCPRAGFETVPIFVEETTV